ncbi:MAG: ZPR1 zinc finger domain-containing protein [Nanoarchaeota archaeon]|nr:ZPR1 zinc finger domain-containing protein [Nanoarchaeota archaeon]
MNEIKGQECHLCGKKTLTLREEEVDVPHFGRVFIFSMQCDSCNFRKADLEPAEQKDPATYTFEIDSEDDLNIKVVKSAEATLKIPRIITIEPGPASEGYITNIEGDIERVKKIIQSAMDSEEDHDAKKKAKNLIKKLNNAQLGREKLKIIISDPTGNSAIISDKAQKSKA